MAAGIIEEKDDIVSQWKKFADDVNVSKQNFI